MFGELLTAGNEGSSRENEHVAQHNQMYSGVNTSLQTFWLELI
jgi:hypothetical protein